LSTAVQPNPPEGCLTQAELRVRTQKRLDVNNLKNILAYHRETGTFTWLVNKPRVRVGMVAGYKDRRGYVLVKINGATVRVHRLVWFFETDHWPLDEIDHINGLTGDNRFINLREANRPQNMANAKMRADNASGRKGVHWCNRKKKWIAQIGASGKRIFLGSFTNKDDASAAYEEAAKKYHKEFART